MTYEVIAPKETAEKARGLEREGLGSPLVGREGELNALRVRVEQLRDGHGGFVAVVGEAGLGKSRLLAELQHDGATEGSPSVTWLEGRAISYGKGISYYPWRAIIRQSVGAHEGDAPETVRRKLSKLCDSECCILPGGDLPFLEAMLAVESEKSLKVIEGLQGDALVEHITNAVRGYVCGLAQEMPLVLVFDDLHWADDASLDLLGKVADLVEKYPLLIICLLRPDKDAASWATIEEVRNRLGERFEDVALNPLSGDELAASIGQFALCRAAAGERARANPCQGRGKSLLRGRGDTLPHRFRPHRAGGRALAGHRKHHERGYPRNACGSAHVTHRPAPQRH